MPRQVDHAARRAELAEATWRVARRSGVNALTVRAESQVWFSFLGLAAGDAELRRTAQRGHRELLGLITAQVGSSSMRASQHLARLRTAGGGTHGSDHEEGAMP